MNRGGKRNGGRNAKFFPSLAPLQRGLDAIYASTPDASKRGERPKGSLDSPSLDDRLEKRAAKLARRAKRAGHKP